MRQAANGFSETAACNMLWSSPSPKCKRQEREEGKKQKQQKKSGMDWARDFEVMPFDSSVLRPLADAAAGAFEARTGKPLDASLAGAGDLPKALYKAPVCVMVVSDETIAYANDAACEFAGKKHTELIGSATTLPATVADGYDSSYEKKLDGNTMQKAKRWAISKMAVVDGELVTEDQGVGYAFEAWVRDEDGALCKPGGIGGAADRPGRGPGPDRPTGGVRCLRTASTAWGRHSSSAQAAVVRDLKEEQGLGNGDPEVKAAVAELLRLKALLEECVTCGDGRLHRRRSVQPVRAEAPRPHVRRGDGSNSRTPSRRTSLTPPTATAGGAPEIEIRVRHARGLTRRGSARHV